MKIFVTAFIVTSCEKEINVDLNSAPPQVIIEGIVTNEAGPYQVQISKSVIFSAANSYPAVSGASVVITDRTGSITDTLLEGPAGTYKTRLIQGIPGHSYDLFVNSEGETYRASSTMPLPVPFDSITFRHSSGGIGGENGINAIPNFQDPPGIPNYYTFNATVNSRILKTTFVFGDRLSDGRYITQQLFMDSAYIQAGNVVSIKMHCVDKDVWNYFNTIQGEGFGSPAPANPISNITNNALGYFSAHTVQTKTAVAY